ncbi:prolyl oligopeptidase [Flavobacterium arsenatis]|uniref:prolyl oligopeptidase n=1 Tax=Flavobacterium arsenatis TaxID=1484332 RepID=A0ABU1TS77_9FLAO|nr:prolyl oligopeptidase family serine peptidase [Flavobacterium arsenatis]MDR6968706.1 prolyl oligopeptidase [Flavobacterium arsenatis]
MNRIIFSLICFFCLQFSFGQGFPVAKKTPITVQKHSISFVDEYPWLENATSAETLEWVENQNLATNNHYAVVTKKYSSRSKIAEYDDLSTNSMPYRSGKYYYSKYLRDRDKPASLYYRKDLNDEPQELVNPYRIYKSNNVVLNSHHPSKSSKYLAVKMSLDGSDRQEIRFCDIDKVTILDDVVKDVKFSTIAWNEDKGVFYKKNSNKNVFEKDSTYQLFYHKIGTTQENDKLLFDATAHQSDFSFLTKENKLLIIEKNKEETARNFYIVSLDTEDFKLEKVIENDKTPYDILHFSKDRIYFSSMQSDWGEIKSFNLYDKTDEKVVIPQIYNHLLTSTHFYQDYIIGEYKTEGRNYMIVYDSNGKFIRKFDVPHNMDFNIRYFDKEAKELYVTFYSYTISYLNYKLNLETGKTGIYLNEYIESKPSLFTFDHFETKKTTYKSRDNKDILMTIVHKKGLKLDGNNPTLLKAYGGFGVISGPSYDTGLLYFLEKGGVFAYAEIRGGGDKGKKWHRDGMGLKKMNTFNDFIDAAEFLIKENYTNPQKLAITGGSQGGLLVGVAMTQRPELFKVAIPEVGVFDMAKFNDYTIGRFHNDEYGNPDVEEEFNTMMQYSPFHKIKEDVNYPITLIITSENDDRVPPIHSYKFAAKLQNRASQKNPIYLKTQRNSGHYGKISNYKEYLEEKAEFYNFLLYHLNN